MLYNGGIDARGIDNSVSMIDECGARINTLITTLRAISRVYSFAAKGGITAVRFLNTSNKRFNLVPGEIDGLMKRIVFEGPSHLGTKLRDKVLVNHVTPYMKKPLLVIIITDAEAWHPKTENSDNSLLT